MALTLRTILLAVAAVLLIGCSPATKESPQTTADAKTSFLSQTTDLYVCTGVRRSGPSDITFTGHGPSEADARSALVSNCLAGTPSDAWSFACHSMAPQCRTARCREQAGSGDYEHHHNWCVAHGYIGYDPTPEQHGYHRGACYRSLECAVSQYPH